MWNIIFFVTAVFASETCAYSERITSILHPLLEKEILSYSNYTKFIVNSLVVGNFKGSTYNNLIHFTNKFGSRHTGSDMLEKSIDFILNQSKRFGFDNVHGEIVEVPRWIRGQESASLLSPWRMNLNMLGLGSSVATPKEGIIAEAIVVKTFDELENLPPSMVQGKIVIYNQDFVSYAESVKYRTRGASIASRFGAVATLIRSVTPFSINLPHTGYSKYYPDVRKIPTACITVEDAEMLHRMYRLGHKPLIHLKMEAKNLPPTTSRNVIADLRGYENPNEVVIISGHIDSWDVGVGALDDAGGALMAWTAMLVLKKLGFVPRRTIRTVLWTAEEQGLIGAKAYYKEHFKEMDNIKFLMESDEGTFNPLGLQFSGSLQAACILEKVLSLLGSINTTKLVLKSDVGSDISVWKHDKIPMAELLSENEQYFWYHHTAADLPMVIPPDVLDRITALWAVVAYVIADLSVELPKGN